MAILLTLFLNILLIVFLIFQIRRFSVEKIGFGFFSIVCISKLIAGLTLGWVYFYHYKMGDTILFYQKAVYLSSIFRVDPVHFLKIIFLNEYDAEFSMAMGDSAKNIPRTIFFVKIVSFLNILTADNYWVNSLYLSLFSFAGSWKLVSVLHRLYPGKWLALSVSFLLFPSVIFWSSGVLKESVFIGSLFFLLALMLEFIANRSSVNIYKIGFFIINLWLLFCLKYFLFAIFISVFGSYVLTSLIIPAESRSRWKLLVNVSIFGIMLLVSTQIHYALSFQYFIHEVITYHDEIFVYTINDIGKSHPSLVYFGSLTENIPSVISKIPMALFTGLFMPLFFRSQNIFQFITACENLVLLLLSLWSISIFIQKSRFDLLKMTMLVYVLICAGIFALTSPNLGTLARYKVAYLPFLLFLITSNTLKWNSHDEKNNA